MSVDRIEARRRGAAIQPGEAEDRSNQSAQSNQSNQNAQPAGSMSDADRIEARRRGAAIQPGEAGGEDQSNQSNQSNQNAQSNQSDRRPSVEDPTRARIEARQADQVAPAAAGGERIAGTVVTPVSNEQLAAARQAVSDDAGRRARWNAMMSQLGVEPPEDEETRRKREKREKWARISAAIGDGISAFANLWSTTQYGPNSRFVSAADRLGERYRAEKEERDKAKDAYFRAWQWFDKRERDQAAADAAQKAAEWDRQLKDREQRRKENKDKEDGARKQKELEHEINMGRAKNAREENEDKRKQALHPLRMDKTKAETARAKAQTVNSYAQARKAAASTKSQPDIKLPNGKIIHSESEAEFKKNAKRYAKLYGIDTFTRDTNGYREKSGAELASAIENLRDHETTDRYNRGESASLEDYYDALIESGFGTDLSAKDLRDVLSTASGRRSVYEALKNQGVPMPMRADVNGKLTEDYGAWSNMMDQMMAVDGGDRTAGTNKTNTGTTGSSANPAAAVDIARRAAEPVLVPVKPAVSDKADGADVTDVTDESEEREPEESGRRYTHTEGLFK